MWATCDEQGTNSPNDTEGSPQLTDLAGRTLDSRQWLAPDRGATTNDPEVAAYWARLIVANRHQLRDPNLILPGVHLVLPA